jgi:hypothetical protein
MEGSVYEDEVVTLFLTNPDGMALESFDRAFKESGAESFCYAPGEGQAVPMKLYSWPILEDMIEKGERVVVFTGYVASHSLLFLSPSYQTHLH